MVQGWESRAHLANKRREDARERKQSKRGPQKLGGEIIINQILKNDFIDVSNHVIEAWVENEAGGKALCYPHFRAEACLKYKRCKFSHALTISLNRGHDFSDMPDDATRSEVHMDCYSDMSKIPAKEYKNLNLLFVDKSCIYDKSNPVVWQRWYEHVNNCKQQSTGSLKTIAEGGSTTLEEEFEPLLSQSMTNCSTKDFIDVKQSERSEDLLRFLSPALFAHVASFSSDTDICNIYMTCLAIKTTISSDEVISHRRKSYLASVTPTGKDLSKQRKQEKKKKKKQANLKDNKKGHKAVKICRK